MGKLKESHYAAAVVGWLKARDWEVYKEVQAPSESGRIIDIYGIQGDPDRPRRAVGVEVKTAFTLRVMEQAEYWKRFTDRTYIAVPESGDSRSRAFGSRICEKFGLGVLLVPENQTRTVALEPYRDVRSKKTGRLRVPNLHPAMKKREAGSAGGERSVSFLNTTDQLRETVSELPGIRLSDALRRIDHHYKNIGSAYSSLRDASIEGVRFQDADGATYLYPIEQREQKQ